MNRYAATFARLASRGECAFIPFAVAGDPDPGLSLDVLSTYIDAGADILEIGYPFSDPIADGPVNQRAAMRAIAAGMDQQRFFALIRRLRRRTDIPFGLLLYTNSVLHYGLRRFCRDAASAGIDSLLLADMPPEEAGELRRTLSRYHLQSVFIVSQLTPPERMRRICEASDGFIYVVSRLGTTGVAADVGSAVSGTLARLKKVTSLPLCVGFGLSTPQQVRAVCRSGADGAIMGSALVAQIERLRSRPERMLATLRRMVRAGKAATRSALPSRRKQAPR